MTLATRSKSPVTAAGPDVTHEGEVPNSAGARTAGACLIALWVAILVAAEVRSDTMHITMACGRGPDALVVECGPSASAPLV